MHAPTTERTGIREKPGTSTPTFKWALHLLSAFHLKITSFSVAKKIVNAIFLKLCLSVS
jgi:hypothetical protein